MVKKIRIKIRGRDVYFPNILERPVMVFFPPKFTGSKQWVES